MKMYINRLRLILSFFTRLDVGNVEYSDDEFLKSICLVPFVGIIIGIMMSILAKLLAYNENKLLVGLLLTIIYIYITGALHIDGVADSFDGLFSSRGKDKVLEIMKDSRIGTFGSVGIVLNISAYIVLLGNTRPKDIFYTFFIGKLILWIIGKVSNQSNSNGMGSLFLNSCSNSSFKNIFFMSNIILILTFIYSKEYLKIIYIFIIYLFIRVLVKKIEKIIECITGDILGMLIEVSQISFLLLVNLF